MRVCWDNIEGLRLSKQGNITDGNRTYIEGFCSYCGDLVITRAYNPENQFC